MYKKPFLSIYELERTDNKHSDGTTSITRSEDGGEPSDDDEYYLEDTRETRSIENSDEDDYYLGSIITESIEESEPDEFLG